MTNRNSSEKKYLKYFWIIILTPICLGLIIIILTALGWLGFMPTIEDLQNPSRDLASEVISEDGKILGTFYLNENRNPVEYKDLSPFLVQALIAREDHRFSKHSGIDGVALFRVAVRTVLMRNTGQGGGSTITQQLAKNLFPRDTTEYRYGAVRNAVTAMRKFKEWVIAVKLEKNYTKDEIITMYLNTVPFSGDAFGIKAASRAFFNKSADSLKIEEASLLIGLLQAPSKFNPVRNPERSQLRRNSVLQKMYEHDYITESQYDSLVTIPVKVKYNSQGHNAGKATYFREKLRYIMTRPKPDKSRYGSYQSFFEDSIEWEINPLYGWCNKNKKPDGSPYNLYTDGLKIYSSINYRMQEYAEEAVKQHLKESLQPAFNKEKKGKKKAPFSNDLTDADIENIMKSAMRRTPRYRSLKNDGHSESEIMKIFKTKTEITVFSWNGEKDTTMSPWDSIRYYKQLLRASFMAMDPHNGQIKAWVGGPDSKYFVYDGVKSQKRQVGSTIKPFLYTLAMQMGFKPCDKVWNVPVTFRDNDTTWTPKNSGETKYDGKQVTLKWGLSNSVNNISAYLIQQFNPALVVDIIEKMGVKSRIDPVPSIFLGTSDISLFEMVGAYSTFANKGVYTEPVMVTRIEDKNGNVIAVFQPQKVEAISEHTSYLMLNLMQSVITGGTGSRLRYRYNMMNELAGKTGTSQNHSDGWFMGISPDLVAGSWVGGEDRAIHFEYLGEGQAAATALPIFGLFMQKVYADKSLNLTQGPFERPVNFNVDMNCPVSEIDQQTKAVFEEEY
jgi:penicillin-binding protein 1A